MLRFKNKRAGRGGGGGGTPHILFCRLQNLFPKIWIMGRGIIFMDMTDHWADKQKTKTKTKSYGGGAIAPPPPAPRGAAHGVTYFRLNNAAITPSRISLSRKSHAKQFSRTWVGRGYLVAVTGCTSRPFRGNSLAWPIRPVRLYVKVWLCR